MGCGCRSALSKGDYRSVSRRRDHRPVLQKPDHHLAWGGSRSALQHSDRHLVLLSGPALQQSRFARL